MISQIQVLSKILQTKDYSIITLNNLDESYFPNCKNEFNFIKTHYDLYHSVPDTFTFLETFSDFEVLDVTEPVDYLINALSRTRLANNLITVVNNMKHQIESDQIEDAAVFFRKAAENLNISSAMTCTDIMQDSSRLDRYIERTAGTQNFYYNTGLPELDEIIGGIDRYNENMVIAARTGIGKTQILLKMAAEASKQGLRVGIYEGEMTVDKVAYRIDTFLGNIPNTALNRGYPEIIAKYKQYIEDLKSQKFGSIKVLTQTDVKGPVTVDALRAFIEREKLDILLVDQYSLMEDTSRAKTMFEKIGNIARDIKKLQVDYKIPIIAVAQMNRTKNEDGSQDSSQIGLSDLIPQYATTLLMLQRDKKDPNLLEITTAKARDGGDGRTLKYKVDWNIGTFQYIIDADHASDEELEAAEDRYK